MKKKAKTKKKEVLHRTGKRSREIKQNPIRTTHRQLQKKGGRKKRKKVVRKHQQHRQPGQKTGVLGGDNRILEGGRRKKRRERKKEKTPSTRVGEKGSKFKTNQGHIYLWRGKNERR